MAISNRIKFHAVIINNSYEALFSLLGTQYGGNGITTFALPDLRGAVPVGMGTTTNGATWEIVEAALI